ncbi:MAG: glycosyltransferase family 2 protein [bacterium]
MRLSVVIPCLNEATTIGEVIKEAAAGIAACRDHLQWTEIIVCDNGSVDGSRDIAARSGARVVACPIRGYGAALHWGFAHARGDFVLFADADMSYDFTLLPRFAHAMRDHPADLVLGSRLRGEILPNAMPLLNRRLGTPLLNLAIWLCFGLRTSDCNSGMRLVRRAFYRELHMRCSGMEWASELLIKTAIRKGRYAEVPIRLRPDRRGRPPHMRRWRDGWRHLKSIVMLAPNITVLAPCAGLAVCAIILAPFHINAALAAIWCAYAGLLVGIGIKLILHIDTVRPSRTIAALLRLRTAELGLLVALAMFVTGIYLLGRNRLTPEKAILGPFLLSGSGITTLGVMFWETVRTHLVSRLSGAWDAVDRHAADTAPASERQADVGRIVD